MTTYFLDTSAIVKRYITEQGSVWVDNITDPATGSILYIVEVTGVEFISAVTRRGRGGSLAPAAAAKALVDFKFDFANQYKIVEMSNALTVQAMALAEKHALRGYDAVQLAAALEVNYYGVTAGAALTVISADGELNDAAVSEGLNVDDPNNH